MWLHKKERITKRIEYDTSAEKPVIRASICTGEKVAGLKDLTTGRFKELMLIRDEKDLDEFARLCGVHKASIDKEW